MGGRLSEADVHHGSEGVLTFMAGAAYSWDSLRFGDQIKKGECQPSLSRLPLPSSSAQDPGPWDGATHIRVIFHPILVNSL